MQEGSGDSQVAGGCAPRPPHLVSTNGYWSPSWKFLPMLLILFCQEVIGKQLKFVWCVHAHYPITQHTNGWWHKTFTSTTDTWRWRSPTKQFKSKTLGKVMLNKTPNWRPHTGYIFATFRCKCTYITYIQWNLPKLDSIGEFITVL